MIKSIVLFGDTHGIPQVMKYIPHDLIACLVMASIRPHQERELRQVANHHLIPLLIQPKRNTVDYDDFLQRIRDISPDLILVNSYSMKLHPDVLELPRHGAINIHGALLPKYRGSNPIQWAIIHNEQETGVTMHFMSDRIDEGPIIAQRRVLIQFNDTWVDVKDRIDRESELLLSEVAPALLSGNITGTPQNSDCSSYFNRRTPEDGCIDWNKSILSIYNLIRALVAPLPGAYYVIDDQRIILDKFLSLAEVASMKYGYSVAAERSESLEFRVLKPPGKSSTILLDILRVNDGASIGICSIEQQDYHLQTVISKLRLKSGQQRYKSEIQDAVQRFSSRELGIANLIGEYEECPE